MKKKLTIALSSVIGTALLATAIAVPVALHQKNKKPLMINNNFGAIKNPKDMNDLMIDDSGMIESHPPLMKSEPVDLSSLINKASLGLIITDSDLPTEKELLDLVKKENPKLSEEALQSLSFENISKEGTTIISKNKDDFSGEIKLEYRSRTNSEQEKYNKETAELVKTTWEKSFKNKMHNLMTFGEIFDSLVRKVNREDSKISIDEGLKKTYITTYLKNGANSGSSGSISNGVQGNSNNKEFVVKVEDKDEIKLEIGFARGGTVPTKYIDKNGKEVSTDSWDLSNVDATVITKIGFHDYKGSIRVPVMPKNVKQVPKELPSVVTSLEKTFKGLKSDKVLGIESWDTSNITNLSETFSDAENFNQDLSNWKTSNVTDMSVTFFNAKKFNSPLDKWDTSNVENMQSMFYGASEFNQNISKWDVKKVKEHSNFCTNSGLKCGMSEPECKAQNCPMFCCENNKQCEMCKKAMEMK